MIGIRYVFFLLICWPDLFPDGVGRFTDSLAILQSWFVVIFLYQPFFLSRKAALLPLLVFWSLKQGTGKHNKYIAILILIFMLKQQVADRQLRDTKDQRSQRASVWVNVFYGQFWSAAKIELFDPWSMILYPCQCRTFLPILVSTCQSQSIPIIKRAAETPLWVKWNYVKKFLLLILPIRRLSHGLTSWRAAKILVSANTETTML